MAEEFLDGADVVAALQEMGGEAVPEGVTAGGFGDAGRAEGKFHGVLKVFLAEVVAAGFEGARVDGEFGCGEDVLPRPGAGGVTIFPVEGGGKVDGSGPAGEVLTVQLLDAREVGLQRLDEPLREEGYPFALAFTFSNGDVVVGKVDVFDAEADSFEEAQAAAVEQVNHEAVVALKMGQDGAGFPAGEDHRKLRWSGDALDAGNEVQFAIENLGEEKEEGAKGLVLGGGGDVAVDGEMGKERGDFGFA